MIRHRLSACGMALGAALAMACFGSAAAQDKIIGLSTLDWPPYTGSQLPGGGATTEVVRAAFAEAGYEINVVYRPWKRAIAVAAKEADGIIAYFPGYHCNHAEGFIASQPIGNGPLGFAEHTDAPISWRGLADIVDKKLEIGTVLGYANTDAFDAEVSAGRIRVNTANDDVTNLKKLLRKRIDAVVIDKLVLEYLKATEMSLKAGADKLRFDEKPLENKTLFLCFRGGAEGRSLMAAFDAGLARIDASTIIENYFATAFE